MEERRNRWPGALRTPPLGTCSISRQLLHQRLFSVNCGRVNDVAPHRDKDANRHGALPESDRKDDM